MCLCTAHIFTDKNGSNGITRHSQQQLLRRKKREKYQIYGYGIYRISRLVIDTVVVFYEIINHIVQSADIDVRRRRRRRYFLRCLHCISISIWSVCLLYFILFLFPSVPRIFSPHSFVLFCFFFISFNHFAFALLLTFGCRFFFLLPRSCFYRFKKNSLNLFFLFLTQRFHSCLPISVQSSTKRRERRKKIHPTFHNRKIALMESSSWADNFFLQTWMPFTLLYQRLRNRSKTQPPFLMLLQFYISFRSNVCQFFLSHQNMR